MHNAMNVIKKSTLIAISIIMILNCNICANAATSKNNSIVSPLYTTIETNTAYISISGIKATCNATVTSQYSAQLKIKMELQKKKSTGYETVETWTSSKYGYSMSYTESRNINVLCDYRLKATITAGSETIVVYDYP